jgi:phage gp29-like protein
VVDGTPTEDQVLTANTGAIADADGLGPFSYQWLRDGTAITGATGATYTLGDADVGTQISVRVDYTDARGTAESLTSAAVGPIANVNDAPTGLPVVDGTPTEDQVLTANTGAIADADGLGPFSYQWLRDGTTISGATGATYTLGDADVGTQISVRVDYTDARGTAESLTSAAVGPIANVNDAPTGLPVVDGTPTEDQVLTANTGAIADADGLGVFSYQWLRDGTVISGATGATYTLGDADVGTQISVRVDYTDARGTAESLTSATVGPIANVNDAPTGLPVVDGTPTEDQVLSANTGAIADADGLGAFSYQWLRDGSAITGATSATYTLGDADVGSQISVRVDYTDARGTAESLTSAAVGPIANVNDAPVLTPVAHTLTPITEDEINHTGQTVASLLGTSVTDADPGAVQGIALTGLTAGNGAWQYSLDGGTNWSAIGTVSDSAALLLRDTDMVRFVPNGENATSATLTYRAWDQTGATTGAQGSLVNTAPQGGTAAFSTASDTATITVTAVNDAPVIHSDGGGATSSLSIVENVSLVTTVIATDVDNATLTYEISGGADAALFQIDSVSGVLSFISAPDHENPLDADGDNVYEVTVRASDGALFDEQAISVTVTGLNDSAPVITSNGGGATASINVAENTTAVTTVTATDADGSALTYSIAGGADAALFDIDATTGVLTFKAAPDFEAPGDAGADNVYDVTVLVSDGTYTDSQDLSITVVNVNETGIGALSDIDPAPNRLPENAATGTPVGITAKAVDADASDTISYSLSDDAGGRFAIDPLTGVVTVANGALLDHEAASSHTITVQALSSDGSSSTLSFSITLTDVNEAPVGPISDVNPASDAVPEGARAGTEVGITAQATDPDATASVSYSLSDDAGGRFTIDAVTGVVTVARDGAFDEETQTTRSITVRASSSDGSFSERSFTLSVPLGNTGAPVFTSPDLALVPENTLAVLQLRASDADTPVAQLRYSIVGGADAALFVIDAQTGALRFATAPDYERPGDAGTNNHYELRVRVSDGRLSTEQTLTVQVQPVNDNAPRFGPDGLVEVAENSVFVTRVQALDDDLPAEALRYAIVGGADAARFVIDAQTGELRFAAAPDHEAPDDADLDRDYQVVLGVSDGVHQATMALTVRVRDLPENPPQFGNGDLHVSVMERQTDVTTVGASSPDNLPLRYSISGGEDAGFFGIDPATGRLWFLTAPQFKMPLDAGGDNVYSVQVQASDGHNTSHRNVYVTVLAQQLQPVVVTPPAVPLPDAVVPAPLPTPADPTAPTPPAGGGSGNTTPSNPNANDRPAPTETQTTPGAADPVFRNPPFGNPIVPPVVALALAPMPPYLTAPAVWNSTVSPADWNRDSLPLWNLPGLQLAQGPIGSGAGERSGPPGGTGREVVSAEAQNASGQAMDAKVSFEETLVAGVSIGVGAAFWASRGGALLASLLAMSPAWRSIDPLPVLSRREHPVARRRHPPVPTPNPAAPDSATGDADAPDHNTTPHAEAVAEDKT